MVLLFLICNMIYVALGQHILELDFSLEGPRQIFALSINPQNCP